MMSPFCFLLLIYFFFNQVIQPLFMVADPVGKMPFNDMPLVIVPVHSENNAIAAIVRHIYMKKCIVISRDPAEVEFAKPVGSFYKTGKVNVF